MGAPQKAIIIGSGVAGLAAAIRLAVQGIETEMFEKNAQAGGKLQELTVGAYHFDAAACLFTHPQTIEELFALAGENIHEYLSYSPLPVSCNYFYEDGTVINAYTDKQLFAKDLAAKTNDNEKSLFSYLERSEKIYDRIGRLFFNFSLHKRRTFLKAPVWKALKASKWSHLFHSLHEVNTKHFKDPKVVQLFNRYATYNGSNPYKAPGFLSLIAHLEHNEGIFYPKGGMISIANALYKLAVKKGVKFHFNTTVQRIISHESKLMGVVVNGENIPADIVISNMDVYFTHKYLLRDDNKARKILKQERSSSAMIFYWGIKKEFAELGLHNVLFSADYKAEFNCVFNKHSIYKDPTVHINVTSKQEPGKQAPAGSENWFVMINVPANSGQDWDDLRGKVRASVIKKINRVLKTDIEPFIEAEEMADPVTIEAATASFMGSLYGTSSNGRSAAFLRHPNFSRTVKGLYFVGGSVHPGGGIPLCLKGAEIVSHLVAADTTRRRPVHL